jgi:hypothetical protein
MASRGEEPSRSRGPRRVRARRSCRSAAARGSHPDGARGSSRPARGVEKPADPTSGRHRARARRHPPAPPAAPAVPHEDRPPPALGDQASCGRAYRPGRPPRRSQGPGEERMRPPRGRDSTDSQCAPAQQVGRSGRFATTSILVNVHTITATPPFGGTQSLSCRPRPHQTAAGQANEPALNTAWFVRDLERASSGKGQLAPLPLMQWERS